jgi:hypothetical protein
MSYRRLPFTAQHMLLVIYVMVIERGEVTRVSILTQYNIDINI